MSKETLGDTVSRISRKRFESFEPNGGERNFSIIPERCYDKSVPFTTDDEITIRITHPNHDVHQLQDTFLYFEFTVVGQTASPQATSQNVEEITDQALSAPRFFLGWRDANQMLKNLRVYSNNVQTDYIQRECAKEGFYKASKMSDEERHCQLFAHTREEDAINYQTGVCGTYITSATVTQEGEAEVIYQVVEEDTAETPATEQQEEEDAADQQEEEDAAEQQEEEESGNEYN